MTWQFDSYDEGVEAVSVEVLDEQGGLRTYRHTTSQALRDEARQSEQYAERAAQPRLRSGNIIFDGLFALAVDEMVLDSVSEIRDASYNGGAAIDCDCFETGEKWNYVWTRDLSYAAHLGLGFLDPQRVSNSLRFKTSPWREGLKLSATVAGSHDGLQIIQDTGSGGSWPISTDRVSWAFGAEAALHNLPDDKRPEFARLALKVLSNTIENDRLAAFDASTGLYTGEQSFLDWREQSYVAWIADDLAFMATSKALSTNIDHFQALQLAASLARDFEDQERALRYQGWANDLKLAINRELWNEDAGLYSSLTAGHFDTVPMPKYDWLGQSLAIISGVATAAQRDRILASYPHGPMGAPVIFPQQPGVPVYHNRGIWPFVTAYGLYAAIAGGNVAVADAAMETLIRAAALNISNMENLEWLSAQPLFEDPRDASLSGPVINSRRQLWSVAAYLGMVIHGIYGIDTDSYGINIKPFLTSEMRRRWFPDSDRVEIQNLHWKGRRLDIRLTLPPFSRRSGYYAVDRVLLDGEPVQGRIPHSSLREISQIEIVLGAVIDSPAGITRVNSDPREFDASVYAPREPQLRVAALASGNRVSILDEVNDGAVYYRVFRNGKRVANKLSTGDWDDRGAPPGQACYAASAVFKSSGNESHHSRPVCIDTGEEIPVADERVQSNVAVVQESGRDVLRDWGKPTDTLQLDRLQIEAPGDYALQIKYHNGHNDINTGITCGVKWLRLRNAAGVVVAEAVVQMPHTPAQDKPVAPAYSTPLRVSLPVGEYQLEVSDFYNMSYLRSNRSYFRGGGVSGPVNTVDIYAFRVLPLPRK